MTLVESAKNFWIRFGMLIRVIGTEMQPDYWARNHCGSIDYIESGSICWKCGIGEMLYKGELYDRDNNSRAERSS